jgi:hypothetical protein
MLGGYVSQTYIRSLLLVTVLQDLPQHIDGSIRLNSDTSQQALVVDITNKCLGVGLFVGLFLGTLGSAGECGLVVEAVKVAASLLELLDPFLRLYHLRKLLGVPHSHSRSNAYLCNHHMTIKGAPTVGLSGLIDVASDGRNNGRTEGDVGNEVAIPGKSV